MVQKFIQDVGDNHFVRSRIHTDTERIETQLEVLYAHIISERDRGTLHVQRNYRFH